MPNYKDQACPRSIVKNTQLQAKKKSLFDASAKIGKLEFLNDFGRGGGSVRKGLEQLAVVSDTVRTGDTDTDTNALLDESGGGLMDSMGLDGAVQTAVAQFDPNAVNGAVGASKALVAKARQGNFRMEDIAVAVGEFKNIAQIAGKIFKPSLSGEAGKDYQKFRCRPSHYASDLVHRAPKQNFQFVVEIELNAAYKNQFILQQESIVEPFEDRQNFTFTDERSDEFLLRGEASVARNIRTNVTSKLLRQQKKAEDAATQDTNDSLSVQLAFLVKNSSKPSITYEYEDLNYYNYRTQGIRKATFNPVTMSFIDDQLNTAAAFYAFYTSAMSPIVNMGADAKNAMNNNNYEQSGMDFAHEGGGTVNGNGGPNSYDAYSASIGSLRPENINRSNTTKRIIDRITIYQFGKNANTFTAYNMFGVRITNFTPSNVDMSESGDGQSLDMEIAYDYFTIQPEMNIGDQKGSLMTSEQLASLTGGDAGATYPIKHFQSDAPPQRDREDPTRNIGSILGLGT